uniref:NB-ARC domain-containing protein n=1 Tax=Hordeum vulgare subsp. vulgare TaxID=112509 RepID=A0A8I6X0Q6_HORVV
MAVKCWMKEAQELSYDILDYIDSRVSLELLECRPVRKMDLIKIAKKLKWQKQIERLKWYQQMIEKVSEFRIYALEAIRRYERYQVLCCSTSTACRFSAIGPIMPMHPPPCEKTCSGLAIDGRMSKFINSQLANDENEQLKVVSIHGSGCLGKTMLAKVLYNKIGRKFDCRAFIQVSKKPDIKKLLNDMLAQIHRKKPQSSQKPSGELRITADNIRNYLHRKRYLFSSCK